MTANLPSKNARILAIAVCVLVLGGGVAVPAAAEEDDSAVKCVVTFQVDGPLGQAWLIVLDSFEPVRELVFDETGDDINLARGPCAPADQANFVWDGAAPPGAEPDRDGDGMGDVWESKYNVVGQAASSDDDNDGLTLINEFSWLTDPSDPDTDDDGWNDGPESTYWASQTSSKGGTWVKPNGDKYAYPGPGSTLDSDGDGKPNMHDADSDNDGLVDGDELSRGAAPEKPDTDGDGLIDGGRPGQPGEVLDAGTNPGVLDSDGDAWDDKTEFQAWTTRNDIDETLTLDTDSDGIINVLDADSDRDGLTDGHESNLLLDPGDPDTDNDGMPDGWELQYNLNPLAADGEPDPDADGLTNLLEYQYGKPEAWNELLHGAWAGGTTPNDADTDGDGLVDGVEVLTHLTNPRTWDTDSDGLPDAWELQYGFDPREVNNAADDPDADFFDQGLDGIIEQPWPNLQEYRYGRPAGWNEDQTGPWQLGTSPLDADSDDDTAIDGKEAYDGTNAHIPANVESDDDGDGLTWSQESNLGTNPMDADTDHDGLCDGGRGPACRFPGMGSTGHQPGEADYGSIPWEFDSDSDGRSDSQEALWWDPGATGSAQDVDGDQMNGVIDSDSDNDGLTDGDEYVRTTDMALADTDADGLKDGDEVIQFFTSPKVKDSDFDGLNDGDEVEVHGTMPSKFDTDYDTLGDGAEVMTHGTNPLVWDTDQDSLPDGWEVKLGTQPFVPDADHDPDADGLNNAREYAVGSKPQVGDSDVGGGDGMPDGYEDQYGLGVLTRSHHVDADGDGATNLVEYNAGTDPRVPDTDGDGLPDGWEMYTGTTDPLNPDSDHDGLNDGTEYELWTSKGYPWSLESDGDTLNGLRDPDSDNDGLSDRDEFLDSRTKPHVKDTDGDGLTDYDEVMGFGGRFDPNDADTDNNGQNDGLEASLLDPAGDTDHDGLKNGEEGAYGTDPTKEDSDCDGVLDRAELTYWGPQWNVGGNRLLNPDVDGDTIKDGVEIGTAGTPSQALYKTRPDVADTDGDGLRDDLEARNNVENRPCNQGGQTASAPAPPLAPAVEPGVKSLLAGLTRSAEGGYVGHDEYGWYIQGGYGVRLYLTEVLPATASAEEVAKSAASQRAAPGTNGKLTNPTIPDTDGDGLSDGQEVITYGTDPTSCDTDKDKLGDGLEVGVGGWTLDRNNECTHRDLHTTTTTNPLNANTDNDGAGLTDRVEDKNANGMADGLPGVGNSLYCGLPGSETDPSDGDSDDDGILDGVEIIGSLTGKVTSPFCFDSDFDGLSDGLEQGVTSPVSGTVSRNVLGIAWPTFQPWQGTLSAGQKLVSPVNNPDWDADGLVDGLEDVNHNGKWGLGDADTSVIGARELNPNDPDFDDDGLSDGLELRVWSRTFPEIVGSPGWSFSQLRFDGTVGSALFNPFETNPRSRNTDGDAALLDGKDINPRADAALHIVLERLDNGAGTAQAFRTLETSDPCCTDGKWGPDLTFTFDVEFLGSVTHASVELPDNIYTKEWTRLPQGTGKLPIAGTAASGLAATKPLNDPSSLAPGLTIDLPDDLSRIHANGVQATINLIIRGYDRDPMDADDPLDFKPGPDSGSGYDSREIRRTVNLISEASQGINMVAGSPDPFAGLFAYELMQADDSANDGDGDVKSALGYRLSDNVPRYFVQNAMFSSQFKPTLPPTNWTCKGTVTCS